MSEQFKISVAVISKNEEDILPKFLNSLKYLNDENTPIEIVLVDSGSDDKTIEIALQYGAKVFEENWHGFTLQKNIALSHCSAQWILALDCDELITPELAFEIKIAVIANKYSGFRINRKTHYLGKIMNYAWQPDRRLRLVNRAANPRWEGGSVHEYLICDGEVANFENHLIHYSYDSLSEHFQKLVKYAELSAIDAFSKGKSSKFSIMLLSSLNAFFKIYFFKRGFLDGYRGFIAAFSNLAKTAVKHFMIWEKSNGSN